jgi:hypothetical protein
MTDDPFLTLLVEALNLTHPRFASGGPAAFAREFYHQFRRLWDKAVPVRLGLGHVMLQDDPALPPGPRPDFLFWQLGEHGQPDRRLAAVSVVSLLSLAVLEADLMTMGEARTDPGYPLVVCVVVGREADLPPTGLPAAEGVTLLVFDTDRWQARVLP